MIDKIGHIKNPLTVIAMFAAIAEVSGTVVLPLLKPEIQIIFVWFLIFFPFMLVAAFFVTLLWKHHVLYAPSDYKSDDNFIKMFRPSFGQFREERLLESASSPVMVAEESIDRGGVQEPAADSTAQDPQNDGVEPDTAVRVDEPASEERFPAMGSVSPDAVMKAVYAEDLAVTKLSMQYNVNFVRNVVPNNVPSIQFTAVASNEMHDLYVSVRYFTDNHLPSTIFSRDRNAFEYYNSMLNQQKREKSILILVLVLDGKAEIYKNTFAERLAEIVNNWNINVMIHVYTFEDLKRDMVSKNFVVKNKFF